MKAISTALSWLDGKNNATGRHECTFTRPGSDPAHRSLKDCRSTHVRLSECVTHLNLTLFSIPLASSWVTPIKDSLLMAMSWSPGLKRPSCREKEKAADVTTEIVRTESGCCLSSKRAKARQRGHTENQRDHSNKKCSRSCTVSCWWHWMFWVFKWMSKEQNSTLPCCKLF